MNIEQKLKQIISEQLGIEDRDLQSETRFLSDMKADSLDLVELAIACEEEWAIAIEDSEWERLETFGQAVKLLESKIK